MEQTGAVGCFSPSLQCLITFWQQQYNLF